MTAFRYHIAGLSMLAAVTGTIMPSASQTTDFGKPGPPIKLAVGYQPYYTEAWSAVVMKGGFWKQHLPPGPRSHSSRVCRAPCSSDR